MFMIVFLTDSFVLYGPMCNFLIDAQHEHEKTCSKIMTQRPISSSNTVINFYNGFRYFFYSFFYTQDYKISKIKKMKGVKRFYLSKVKAFC